MTTALNQNLLERIGRLDSTLQSRTEATRICNEILAECKKGEEQTNGLTQAATALATYFKNEKMDMFFNSFVWHYKNDYKFADLVQEEDKTEDAPVSPNNAPRIAIDGEDNKVIIQGLETRK